MKKILIVIAAFVLVYFAYDFYHKNIIGGVIELEQGESVMIEPQFDMVFDASVRLRQKGSLTAECGSNSEIICAVETMVKCTIEPELLICSPNIIPDFVLMEGELPRRPTEISFQITGMKALDKHTLEVYTKSSCDGQWFGLCQGRVVYVIDNAKGHFRVKEVYMLGE